MRNIEPSKSGKYLTSEEWDAMKAAGFSEGEMLADQPFGPMISSYTRAQAIDDGVLVDVTPQARKAGFKLHTVVTHGVAQAMFDLIRRRKPQDVEMYGQERVTKAAIEAMLCSLHEHIRRMDDKPTDRLDFEVGGCKLWAHVGPGDDAEAVLTVMLEGED